MCLPASLPALAQSTGLHLCWLQLQVLTMKAILRGHWWALPFTYVITSAQLLLLQELVNRWSEQIFGAHRDERETADLHERHAQMQEARTARKVAEERAAAADSYKPVSWRHWNAECSLSVCANFPAMQRSEEATPAGMS